MKKSFALLVFLLSLTILRAQEEQVSDKSTLQTKGVGEMRIAPDKAIVSMNISAHNLNFNSTIQELNKKVVALEKEIESAGFKKTDLKTTGYVVNKNIIYRNDGPVDSGYVGRQTFYLEFPNEQQRIVNLVKTLSQSKVSVDFNFSFTLSDIKQEEVEKELIKRAYKDAEAKAKVISEASGTVLKRIVKISYGIRDSEPRPFANVMFKEQAASADFSGFTVKELELSDEITVTWEID